MGGKLRALSLPKKSVVRNIGRMYVLSIQALALLIRANGGWTALKYAKETYKAVKSGGKKFSALTQRVETVINLLIEAGGI